MIVQIYTAILCGFLDRIRGDRFDFINKSVEAVLYGMAVAITLGGSDPWIYPLFAGLWALGASFGWGEPIGAALERRKMVEEGYEWWQFGKLKENVWLALTFRGFLWALPTLPLVYFDPIYLASLGMIGIFPFAVWFDKKYEVFAGGWEEQELVRGWSMGLTALTAGILF